MPKTESMLAKAEKASAEPQSTALALPEPSFDVGARSFCPSPYLVFAEQRSQTWPKLVTSIPGVENGDPCLILPDPKAPIKLSPLRFVILTAKQYFAEMDQIGQIVQAQWEEPEERGSKLREMVEAAILVLAPERAIAARCTFKSTKCGAVHTAIEAVKAASRPDWGKQSPAHEMTLAIPDPRFRAVTQVRVQKRVGSAGFSYYAATGVVQPTSAGDAKLLKEWQEDPESAKAVRQVVDGYNARVAEITDIIGG